MTKSTSVFSFLITKDDGEVQEISFEATSEEAARKLAARAFPGREIVEP